MFIDVISGAFETQIQSGLVSSHNLCVKPDPGGAKSVFRQEMIFESYLRVGF